MSLRATAFFFISAFFAPSLATAEGNLHLGQMEIHPFVSVAETYSDNIYSTPGEKKYDYITTTTPGISLQIPFRLHKLSLDYNAVIRNYGRYTDENTTDQNADALLDLKFGSFLGLKLNDAYSKGHEPRGSSSTGFIVRYETNAASASATYQMADRSKIRIDYSKTVWTFDQPSDFRDRGEDLVSGYLYYRFLPKTSAFIEYDFKRVDFRNPAGDIYDNKVQSGLLGLTWEMTETTKGVLKGGYLKKDFDSPLIDDYSTWTASLDLNFDFSQYTSLKLTGQRTVNETNLQQTTYFVTTGVYAEFTQQIYRRLAAVIRGSYGEDQFSNAVPPATDPRRDITATGGAGLKYTMRDWLEFDLDYNRSDRNSNDDGADYQSNLYTASAKLAL